MPTQEERVKVIAEVGLDGGENLDNLEERLQRLQKVNNTKVKALDTAFSDVDKRVKAVNKSALTLVATLERLGNKSGAAGLNQQAQGMTKAEIAAAKLDAQARKVQQTHAKLNAESQKIAASFDRAANAQKRADQETQRLANSQKKLEIQTKKLNDQLSSQASEKFRKNLAQIQGTIDKVGSSIESAGKKLTVGLTAPLIAAGVASGKFSGDLEESIAEISTIAPQIDTSKLNKQLTDMSTRIPVEANQLAAAVYNIFSSIDANQDEAVGLVEIFAKGARAAKTDVDTFGTAILGVLNAYKLDISQASEVSDIFFNTVNKGVINGQELATGLGDVTQSAKLAGVSFQDLGAYIAAVTKEGGNASKNVNNLNNVFSKIVTPDAQEKLEKLLGKGSTTDAQGNFLPIIDVLDKLKAKLDTFSESDRAKALQDIFPDLQARTGIATLISQLDFLRDTMKYNEEQAGSTEAAYKKMVATTNAQFQLLKNIAVAALISIGNSLLPVLVPLFQRLGEFIKYLTDRFNELSPSTKQFLGIFSVIAAAIGPVLTVVGAIITFLSPLIGLFGSLFSILGTIGGAFVSLGGFISSFIGLIGTAGLGASVSALVSVLGTTLVAALTAAAIALGKVILAAIAIGAVLAVVIGAVTAFAYLLYRVWTQNIGGIQQKTAAAFGAIKSFIISTFNQIKKIFLEVLPYLESITQKVLGAIQEFWDLHGESIISVVKVIWNVIKTVVTEGINFIGKLIKLVLQVIDGDWKGAWDSYKSIVESGWKIIGTIIGAGVRLVIEFIQFLLRSFFYYVDKFIYAAIELAKNFIKGLVDTLKNAPSIVGNALKYLITQAVFDAGNAIYNAGVSIWGFLKSGFTGGAAADPLEVSLNTRSTADQRMSDDTNTLPNPFGTVTPTSTNSAKLPTGKYTGGDKKKKGGSKRRDYEPIDKNEVAQLEQVRLNEQYNIKVELDNLERARDLTKFYGTEVADRLKLASIAIVDYYKRIREERAKDFDLEIQSLEQKRDRAQKILSKITGSSKDDKKERDAQLAEITQLNGEIARKRADKDISRVETYRDELDAILEQVDATQELYENFLSINDEVRKYDQTQIDKEFDKRIEQNRLDLTAARARLKEAEDATKSDPQNQILVERYKLLVETLTKNAEYLESIRNQKELQADFNENQRQLNKILDSRQTALDNLNRSLEESGADEDSAIVARRALMQSYQADIDKVIERLEFLATALKNPEAKKALEALRKSRADENSVPFSEKLRKVQRPLEDSLSQRDRRLKEVELSGASDIQKEIARRQILKETTAELLKQADAYVALAMASGNPEIIQNALAQRDAIRESALEIQSFSSQLKAGAIDAFSSGLTQFFQDLASGSITAGEALLNFASSFVSAIQQIIIQMLALMAIKALLKAFGIDIPISLGGGVAAGGKKNGGSASTLPIFSGNFANGGAPGNKYSGRLLMANGGMIRGVGSSRSDSIPTYFPAAQRFGKTSNTEFVVDAETTGNVGVERLNALLATKGRNFDELFGLGLRDGGAAAGVSDAVDSSISNFELPSLDGMGSSNTNLNQLNYIGKKSIEEVIADHGLSSSGDRLLINQIDRNLGKIKAKLGIKGK